MKTIFQKQNIIILYMILFFGCGSSSINTFDNLKKEYPESRFLSAIGQGDNLREAEKNAIAKLSNIFQSKINVNQTLSENYSEFSDDDNSTIEYKSKLNKRINLSSKQELINVKTGKHYTDENGKVYVVAYINRLETAFIYEERIQNNDNTIQTLVNQSKQVNKKIIKYASFNKAVKLINENIELIKQLSIISPNTVSFEDELDKYNLIKREKGKLANSIIFSFDNNNNEITNTLIELLTSEGFKIGNNGDYKIYSTINYEKVDLGRSEVFYTWESDIKLKDIKGDTIFSYRQSGREGGKTESSALARMKYAMNQDTAKKFIVKFEEYLDSLLGS